MEEPKNFEPIHIQFVVTLANEILPKESLRIILELEMIKGVMNVKPFSS